MNLSNDNSWFLVAQFLSELFHNLGPDCKTRLSIILPTLVENLGVSNTSLVVSSRISRNFDRHG